MLIEAAAAAAANDYDLPQTAAQLFDLVERSMDGALLNAVYLPNYRLLLFLLESFFASLVR